MEKRLPTIAELHQNPQEAFKNDQLNLLLNQPPSENWLKKYPAAMKIPGDGKYLPIDKVDFLLKYIFGRTKIEVIEAKEIRGEMHLIVRIHYKDPVTGEWDFQDGVGAHPIYEKAGGVKTSTAIAKQQAKKDAADELGAVFGRDLGRKDIIQFAGAMPEQTPEYSQSLGRAGNKEILVKKAVEFATNGQLTPKTAETETIPFSTFKASDL